MVLGVDWIDLPFLIVLGFLAGSMAGILGIGGGLIFSPLLLWIGMTPHQALATSSFAILPTAMASSLTHIGNNALPTRHSLLIGLAAFLSAFIFGGLSGFTPGWLLIAMRTLIYFLLAFLISKKPAVDKIPDNNLPSFYNELALIAVGSIAGCTSGMLGLGGGLVMVPIMSGPLNVPIHKAVRISTFGVFCSAFAASLKFLYEDRGVVLIGIILGGVAAIAANFSSSYLDKFNASFLFSFLRVLVLVLAVDSFCRMILLLL